MQSIRWTNLASLNVGRTTAQALNFKDTAVVLGGYSDEKQPPFLSSMEIYDSKSGLFIETSGMKVSRTSFQAVPYKGGILAIGGYNGEFLKSVEWMSPDGTWYSEINGHPIDLNEGRTNLRAIPYKGGVLAIGGYDGKNLNSVEWLDPTTDTWLTKIDGHEFDLKLSRSNFQVAPYKGGILAIGGFDGKAVKSVEWLDPETDTWISHADLNHRRDDFQAIPYKDGVLAIGGYDGESLKSVEWLNPKTDTWFEIGELNVARANFRVLPYENGILAVAGYNEGNLDSVEWLDPNSLKWNLMSHLSEGRSGHNLIPYNYGTLAIGGFNGISLSSVELSYSMEITSPSHLTTCYSEIVMLARGNYTGILPVLIEPEGATIHFTANLFRIDYCPTQQHESVKIKLSQLEEILETTVTLDMFLLTRESPQELVFSNSGKNTVFKGLSCVADLKVEIYLGKTLIPSDIYFSNRDFVVVADIPYFEGKSDLTLKFSSKDATQVETVTVSIITPCLEVTETCDYTRVAIVEKVDRVILGNRDIPFKVVPIGIQVEVWAIIPYSKRKNLVVSFEGKAVYSTEVYYKTNTIRIITKKSNLLIVESDYSPVYYNNSEGSIKLERVTCGIYILKMCLDGGSVDNGEEKICF